MLPDTFPNGTNDIYVIFSGDFSANIKVLSAQEFVITDSGLGGTRKPKTTRSLELRVDNLNLTEFLLQDLRAQNDGEVDYTKALEQGQDIARRIRDFVLGYGAKEGGVVVCGEDGKLSSYDTRDIATNSKL